MDNIKKQEKVEKKLEKLTKYLYFKYKKYISNINFKVNRKYYKYEITFNKIGYSIERQEIGTRIEFYDEIKDCNIIRLNKLIKTYIKNQIKGGNW